MSDNKTKIAVIGAGIIGTTSALFLIESIPNIDITIIAENFSPNTTGDGSAGLIYPYLPGKTPSEKFQKWLSGTNRYLKDYFFSPMAGKLGIGLLSMYVLFGENETFEEPESTKEMISYRQLTQGELSLFPSKWTKGAFVTTYYAEPSKMIPFFLEKFKSKSGRIVQKRVNSLEELYGKYDIVINCTGVEATNLVNDNKAQPIRGQVIRVYAPWIKHSVMGGDHYIIPNSDCVILGGTKGYGNWSRDVDSRDSKNIIEGCCQLFPSLRAAQVLKEWVGLRPGRESVRLETELLTNGDKSLHVVHNYGHGGSGVTLSFGCAQEVVEKVNDIIVTKQKSKL